MEPKIAAVVETTNLDGSRAKHILFEYQVEAILMKMRSNTDVMKKVERYREEVKQAIERSDFNGPEPEYMEFVYLEGTDFIENPVIFTLYLNTIIADRA